MSLTTISHTSCAAEFRKYAAWSPKTILLEC
jgi:hypothetical protein